MTPAPSDEAKARAGSGSPVRGLATPAMDAFACMAMVLPLASVALPVRGASLTARSISRGALLGFSSWLALVVRCAARSARALRAMQARQPLSDGSAPAALALVGPETWVPLVTPRRSVWAPHRAGRAGTAWRAIATGVLAATTVFVAPAPARAEPVDVGGLTLGGPLVSGTEAVPEALLDLRMLRRTELRQPSGEVVAVVVEFASPDTPAGTPPDREVVLTLDAAGRIMFIQRVVGWTPTDRSQAAEIMREAAAKYGPATFIEADDDGALYALYREPRGTPFPVGSFGRARAQACEDAIGATGQALSLAPTSRVRRVDLPADCGIVVSVNAVRLPSGVAGSVGTLYQNAIDCDALRRAMGGRPRL